jgi:DNA invertase Pin-like site-specific DNA recombinase
LTGFQRRLHRLLPGFDRETGQIRPWSRSSARGCCQYLNGGNWQITGEFTEVESGRNSDRPQLKVALAAARVRQIPIVMAKVDRLTRSVAFLSQLLEAAVDVRFADLPQLEGPAGRFMLQQMAAVAELEAGFISVRTKVALAAAKRRGKKARRLSRERKAHRESPPAWRRRQCRCRSATRRR